MKEGRLTMCVLHGALLIVGREAAVLCTAEGALPFVRGTGAKAEEGEDEC